MRFIGLIFIFSIIGETNAQSDNTLDTLKKSINEHYTIQLNFSDSTKESVKRKINEKINQADLFLQTYVQLVRLSDTVFYLKKAKELEDIKGKEAIKPTKDLLNKRTKVLIELSMLDPQKSLPYYIEWLQIIYFPDTTTIVGNKQLIITSDDFCFFKAHLYSLLIKQFPKKRSLVYNLGITYYNHAAEIVNAMKSNNDTNLQKQQQANVIRFVTKAKPYLEKAKTMEK